MTMDVETTKPDEPATTTAAAAAADTSDRPADKALAGLKGVVQLLEKSVKTKETRMLMGRLLRQTAAVRKLLTSGDVLKTFLVESIPSDNACLAFLQAQLDKVFGLVCRSSRVILLHTLTGAHTDTALY